MLRLAWLAGRYLVPIAGAYYLRRHTRHDARGRAPMPIQNSISDQPISDDAIAYARAQIADMRDRLDRVDAVLAGTGVSPAGSPAINGDTTAGRQTLPDILSEEAIMALSQRMKDLMDAVTRATSVEESLRVYQSEYARMMQEHADDDAAIDRLTKEVNDNQDAITRAITANVGIVPATSPIFAPAGVNAGSPGPVAATPAMPNAAGQTLAGSAQTPEGMATAPSPADAPAATGAPVPAGVTITPGVDFSIPNTTAAPVVGPNPTHDPNPADNAPVANPDPSIPAEQQKQPLPDIAPTDPAATSNAPAANVDIPAAVGAAQDASAGQSAPAASTPAPAPAEQPVNPAPTATPQTTSAVAPEDQASAQANAAGTSDR